MKLTKKEALNEVAKVLQSALDEYEALEKFDFGAEESQEEKEPTDESEEQESEESPEEEQQEESQEGQEEPSAESESEPQEEGEEEDEDKMDDETLKSEYGKLMAKMEKRGLLNKTAEVKKSETVKTSSDLKKYESQISDLTKTVNDLQAAIKKIASAPAPRRGTTGYSPLKKNTEGEEKPLNKGEVVSKLLDLKKSGKNIPTGLINRVEGNRLSNEDVTIIKGLMA